MATWLDSIVSPLNAAGESLQKLIEVRDLAKFGDTFRKMHGEVLAAMQGAVAAQTREAALLEQVSELKKRVTDLETWDTERKRYERREVAPSVLAYVLKENEQGSEPFHMLCAKCYHDRQPSELQATQRLEMRRRVHFCPRCKTDYVIGAPERPSPPVRADTEFDPFNP